MSLILLIALLLAIAYAILIYNRLIGLIESVNNNHKQIDIQLDRRFKVFESLINVVKKYMDYEKSTLKEVIALRSKAEEARSSGDDKARFDAENQISGIASQLNLVFEQYPDLKANQNAMQLQEEIVSTENKLAYAKQSYNDSVELYNVNKQTFPANLVVAAFNAKLNKDFIYWNLSEAKIAEQEAYTVKL